MRFIGAELWAWARGRRQRVVVGGNSMIPTLEPGAFVLMSLSSEEIPDGAIVVARHPREPGLLIVKRSRVVGEEFWLTSDNQAEGSDSRDFGTVPAASVLGLVTLVLDDPRRPIASPS